HSFSYELITIGFMLLGALNFNLHYQFWNGNFKELYKDTEIKTFFLSITFLFFFIALGLCFSKIYPKTILLFRKGFYQFISAHTGTGYSTIYSSRLVKEWSDFSKFLLIIAMAFGGGVCSTTGAIKMLRIAIFFKTLKEYIKRIMLSEKILVMEKIHHLKDLILEDKQINLVFLIILTYITIYLAGALVGVFYGYPFLDSLFESISATANVGLSSGITKTTMPMGLKFVYIFQMWAGRLEFMAIFTLFGFLVSIFKGK
ncbi:MAG: potassium transporter TrkG, partial [Candidatus Aenigmatarchaeota archaeon]